MIYPRVGRSAVVTDTWNIYLKRAIMGVRRTNEIDTETGTTFTNLTKALGMK